METFIAISSLVALAAAAPRGLPSATTDRINVEVTSSIQPGGVMLPTGSVLPTLSGSGLPGILSATGSRIRLPSGGFPSGSFPSGAFPFPFPSGGFQHGHHPHGTGVISGAAAPTGLSISARDAAASFTEPIASGSPFSFPAAASSVSFPASGFAKPTGSGSGSGEPSFSFPAFGSSGAESIFAKPTGLNGDKPSFSFSLQPKSGSGFAVPTGFGKDFKEKFHHHHAGTDSVGAFAAPTGSFGGFPSGSFSGLPSGTFSLPEPTATASV